MSGATQTAFTNYRAAITALPSNFVRNTGLNIIEGVYTAYTGVSGTITNYVNGLHETIAGSDITATAVINALPVQSVTEGSQALAVNGTVDLKNIRIRNGAPVTTSGYSFLVANTGGILAAAFFKAVLHMSICM